MQAAKIGIWAINIIGGIAVLGSYVLGIKGHPGQGERLWGGVPDGLRPLYTVSMLLSAAGYLVFLYHIGFRMDPDKIRFPMELSYSYLIIPFVLILLPSIFWMSTTFSYIATSSTGTWILVRVILALVALGSILLLAMLFSLKTISPDQFWWPSVIGAVVFTIHTLILDAILWPALFTS